MYAMLHACRDFERMLTDKRVGGHVWQKDFGAKIWGLQGMFCLPDLHCAMERPCKRNIPLLLSCTSLIDTENASLTRIQLSYTPSDQRSTRHPQPHPPP